MREKRLTAIPASGLAILLSTTTAAGVGGEGPDGLAPDRSADFTARRMFVGNRVTNEVDVHGRNGQWRLGLPGFDVPFGIDAHDGDLYVVSQGSNEIYVYRHDREGPGWRGRPERIPRRELLVEAGSGGLNKSYYTTVADDMLYVSSYETDQVLRYDAETGEFIGVAVDAGAGGLDGPRGLDFDSRGRLYVSSSLGNEVIVYSRHGEVLGHMAIGIPTPCGLSISRHDEICVGSAGGDGVHCYDPAGAEIYSNISGGVCGLDFGPRGELYTTRGDLQACTTASVRAPRGRGSPMPASLGPLMGRVARRIAHARGDSRPTTCAETGRAVPFSPETPRSSAPPERRRDRSSTYPTPKERAMYTNATTAILDMHEPLDAQRKMRLDKALGADPGVVSVGSPRHLPRLLMVAYNPTLTRSSNIAREVDDAGLWARIVGCA